MLSIVNGSDKPITITVGDKTTTLGAGMQPYYPCKYNFSINGIPISAKNYQCVTVAKPEGDKFWVAGSLYQVGDSVTSGNLFLSGNKLYDAFSGIIKNFISDSKMRIKIETSQPVDILNVSYQCGDLFLTDASEVVITRDGKTITTIDTATIKINFPGVSVVVLCDSATETEYTNCEGVTTTQDLSQMYHTLDGKAFIGGKMYINTSGWGIFLILVSLIIIGFVLLAIACLIVYVVYKKVLKK